MTQVTATARQVREARAWIADCEWGDLTPAAIRRLTPEQIVRGVQANYCGGWDQFAADSE